MIQIRYPLLSGALVIIIWGVNVVAIKVGVSEVSPALFNALRFGALSLCLIPFARVSRDQLAPICGIGLLMGMGHFYLLSVGVTYVDSNTTVILIMLGAPISSLLAYLFRLESINRRQAFGIGAAFLGAILPVLLSGAVEFHLGAFFITLSMIAWALTNIWVRQLDGVPLLTLQFWIGLISTPLCLLTYSFEDHSASLLDQLSLPVLISVGYMVLFSSIIAYSLWYATVNQYGINRVVNLTLLQPAFTAIAAYLILGEWVTATQLSGAAITLAGLYYFYRNQSQSVSTDGSSTLDGQRNSS